MTWRRRCVACGLGVLALLASSRNAAADSLNLRYEGPPECTSAERIEAEVVRIVGRPLSALRSSWKEVECSIEQRAEKWLLTVRVVSVEGVSRERTLLAPTCPEAAEAALLVIATSLTRGGWDDVPFESSEAGAAMTSAPRDPTQAESGVVESPPPSTSVPVKRVAKPMTSATAPSEPRGRAPQHPGQLRLFGNARAGLDFATLPDPWLFGELAVGVALPRAALVAHAFVSAPRDVALPNTSGGATVSLVAGGLDGCYRPLPLLRGCAGIELGRLHARGYRVTNPREANGLWSAGRLGFAFTWPVAGQLSLLAGLDFVLLFRPLNVQVTPSFGYRLGSPSVRPGFGLQFG